MKNQTKSNLQTILFTVVAVIFVFTASSSVFAQGIGAKYGARDPQTCADKKAPAKGAITAALAAKYVNCEREKVSGQYLYLVENVTAQVGTSRPYNPNMDLNVPEIDVRFPLYPIRGSLVSYQCYEVNPNFTVSAPGKNCNRTNEPEAKGFCYKTTFGEWRCHMADFSNKIENWAQGVPPPKGKTAAETNDKPADTKTVNQTAKTEENPAGEKDANGFVKPDFSEMADYFDIIRYEYEFSTRELYIVAKMKKKFNPNKWLVEFFDADGARLKWGNTILHYTSGPDPQPGQVIKVYAGTPTEKQMRDEVKKISVTRVFD
ncbi:MAG TPA: hypothetical protein PKY59_02890 [Pyrinomonadaceae bacterium]|nr:hypothetical protein [Pyrinomonadaceae bacterium]